MKGESMSEARRHSFLGGASLTWRRQRLVWWIFVVSLALGGFMAHEVRGNLFPFLDHSLAAGPLVHGFDFGTISLLAIQPEAPLAGHSGLGLSTVYFLFMLFITGGVLEVYRRDDKVPTASFFEACGTFFWRFVRLCLIFIIVLVPVGLLAALLWNQTGRLMDRSVPDTPGLWFYAITTVVVLFLLMTVRLWFDMAQVITVAENERKVRRALKMAAGLLRRNFLGLFWLYFRISFIGFLVFALGLWAWEHLVPAPAVGISSIFLQVLILWWIATRLWQRASETLWYRGYQPEVARVLAPAPLEPALITVATP
jgi:hypothetical protein